MTWFVSEGVHCGFSSRDLIFSSGAQLMRNVNERGWAITMVFVSRRTQGQDTLRQVSIFGGMGNYQGT